MTDRPCPRITETFGFCRNAAFLKAERVLVVSDLHIGLEDELRVQGLHFPLREEEELRIRFEVVLDRFDPALVILNGDIIHSFSGLSGRVKEKFHRLLALIRSHCDVKILRGSHDRLLRLAEKDVDTSCMAGCWIVTHGDFLPAVPGSVILGHEHPVMEIDMVREPCFLYGNGVLGGRDILVTPAFNPLCQGIVVNTLRTGDLLSPVFAGIDPGQLFPLVESGGEVFVFPPLDQLRGSTRQIPSKGHPRP